VSVKITIPSYLQPYTDGREVVTVNGSTVYNCILDLFQQFPDIKKMLFDDNNKLLPYASIYVNGADAYPDELSQLVNDEDELYLLYIIGGG